MMELALPPGDGVRGATFFCHPCLRPHVSRHPGGIDADEHATTLREHRRQQGANRPAAARVCRDAECRRWRSLPRRGGTVMHGGRRLRNGAPALSTPTGAPLDGRREIAGPDRPWRRRGRRRAKSEALVCPPPVCLEAPRVCLVTPAPMRRDLIARTSPQMTRELGATTFECAWRASC